MYSIVYDNITWWPSDTLQYNKHKSGNNYFNTSNSHQIKED